MPRSLAYQDFRRRYRELQLLLDIPRNNISQRKAFLDLEVELALARAIVVLLGGHIEGYFNSLSAEIVGLITDTWDTLPPGQKKYVSSLVFTSLQEILKEFDGETFSEERRRTSFKTRIGKTASWFDNPDTVEVSVLKGFYRYHGPDAVEKLLQQFRPDHASFYGWLQSNGVDLSRVKTVLTQLLIHRTEIAHGELDTQPTIGEARLYVLTATVVVRMADAFMKEPYPNLGSAP